MEITEAEFAKLIRESTRERVVHGSFGHGLIWLVGIPENQWAIKRVEDMRREPQNGGQS